jgi:hypothetical protein
VRRSDPPDISREIAKVASERFHAIGADNHTQCPRFFVPFSDIDGEIAEYQSRYGDDDEGDSGKWCPG